MNDVTCCPRRRSWLGGSCCRSCPLSAQWNHLLFARYDIWSVLRYPCSNTQLVCNFKDSLQFPPQLQNPYTYSHFTNFMQCFFVNFSKSTKPTALQRLLKCKKYSGNCIFSYGQITPNSMTRPCETNGKNLMLHDTWLRRYSPKTIAYN